MQNSGRTKLKIIIISLSVLWFINQSKPVWAVSLGTLGLNTSITYDIYFGVNEESSNVIRDVKLIRAAQIGNKIFLIIEPETSRLNADEGFIGLDSVLAFVPHKSINVERY